MRAEMERHDGAREAYETAGLQTLELARKALIYVGHWKDPHEQAPHENSRIDFTFGRAKPFPH